MHRISPYRDGNMIAGRLGGMRQDGTLYRALPFRKDGRLFFRRLHESAPDFYDIVLGSPYRQPKDQENPDLLCARSHGVYVNPRIPCHFFGDARVYALVTFGDFGTDHLEWQHYSNNQAWGVTSMGTRQGGGFHGDSIYLTSLGVSGACEWYYAISCKGYVKEVTTSNLPTGYPTPKTTPETGGSGYLTYNGSFRWQEGNASYEYVLRVGGYIGINLSESGSEGITLVITFQTLFPEETGLLGGYYSDFSIQAIYRYSMPMQSGYRFEKRSEIKWPQSGSWNWPPPVPAIGQSSEGRLIENNLVAPDVVYLSFPIDGHKQLANYFGTS